MSFKEDSVEQNIALELKHISKYFGNVVANKDVDLTVYRGEILALLGENGSGKTTLMNMIAGIYYPDEGTICIDGEEAVIRSPKDAFRYKIGMIHQHFKLVDVFTAAENIALGNESGKNYSLVAVNRRVREIADRYGFRIDLNKKIYEMSVSEKQTVEIVKVLYRGADILILDEPTAVLTPQETEKLFSVIRAMKADGKSIIIITHKLNEVMSVSDRVAVLRKGEYIGCVNTAETTEQALTEMMVGQKIELNIERPVTKFDRPLLEIRNLCVKNDEGSRAIEDLSFFIRAGEILGVAGIAGSGQRELLEAIAGLQKVQSGDIFYFDPQDGNRQIDLRDKSPIQIRDLGVRLSFVPEDRLGMGLAPSMSVTENMMLKKSPRQPLRDPSHSRPGRGQAVRGAVQTHSQQVRRRDRPARPVCGQKDRARRGAARHRGAGHRHALHGDARAAALGRERAESASGARDPDRSERAHYGLSRARAGHQLVLYDLSHSQPSETGGGRRALCGGGS